MRGGKKCTVGLIVSAENVAYGRLQYQEYCNHVTDLVVREPVADFYDKFPQAAS